MRNHQAAQWLSFTVAGLMLCLIISSGQPAFGQAKKKKEPAVQVAFPPKLPDGKELAMDKSDAFLKPVGALQEGVVIAKAVPTIDFMYYPGQDYAGKPWSVWGDGSAVGDKYYSAIGDHKSPKGTAYVCEYDSATKKLRNLVDVSKFLESAGAIPAGMNYAPAKIHGRVDMGSDGWLYYSTHRGSPGTTNDTNGYQGDWIFRTHPTTGKTEIVATHPVPKHCIPCSVLDPKRLIFYGGTAHGKDAQAQGVQFLAYDIKGRKVLYSGPNGPARYMFLASSTGKLYFTPKDEGPTGELMCYDPEKGGEPVKVGKEIGLRAATQETPQGLIYTVSKDSESTLWSFNTKTEEVKKLGSGSVGKQTYIATLDVDPTGRYLYYVPGAHGGGAGEGTPVVQYDVKTGTRKVIAFVHPFYQEKYGYVPDGSFGSAISPSGDKLYITWNGIRNGTLKGWDACALTVIHIPESERIP